jgi:hypothetical protein
MLGMMFSISKVKTPLLPMNDEITLNNMDHDVYHHGIKIIPVDSRLKLRVATKPNR